MAEVTIRLRHNPETGERELVVAFESDSDALPFEHEQDHRGAVEELLGASVKQLQEAAEVSREEERGEAAEQQATAEGDAAREARAETEGGEA